MAIFDKFQNIVSFWYSEPPPGLCFGEKVPRPTQPPLPAESFYHRRKTTEVATNWIWAKFVNVDANIWQLFNIQGKHEPTDEEAVFPLADTDSEDEDRS